MKRRLASDIEDEDYSPSGRKPYHRINYSPEIREKVCALLENYPIHTVFSICGGQIPLRTLRTWKKWAEGIETTTRKRGSGYGMHHPDLDLLLLDWYIFEKAKRKVEVNELKGIAERISKELGVKGYQTSLSYIRKFMNKHELPMQKINPEDLVLEVKEYFDALDIALPRFQPPNVWNIDEVTILLEPNFRTRGPGADLALLVNEKARLTLVLAVSAAGHIVPPVLIFLSRDFIEFTFGDALVASNSDGYADSTTFYKDALPHLLSYIPENSLLIMDSFKPHASQEVKKLLAEYKVESVLQPASATSILSPIKGVVAPLMKKTIQSVFEEYCFEISKEMKSGKRRKYAKPDNIEIAKWVAKACRELSVDNIKKAFVKTGILSLEEREVCTGRRLERVLESMEDPDEDFMHDENCAKELNEDTQGYEAGANEEEEDNVMYENENQL